jgi:glycosyltransferase involved in cell wall biosynthesis
MSLSAAAVILLATRNGERFLRAQLDSILSQTRSDWRLVVRDDSSEDTTPAILKALASQDRRISILPGNERLGSAGNFSRLMSAAPAAPHYFFCDQDDVWPQDRLERMLETFAVRNADAPTETPALLHTDLRLIDSNGAEIAPSMHQLVAARHAEEDPLGLLLAQNFVTGCSVMFNDALRRLAAPFPAEAINHDWWLALIAAAAGRIHYLDEALVDHRRHDSNTNRISRDSRWTVKVLSDPIGNPARRRLFRRLAQSAALEARLAQRAPECPELPRLQAWNAASKQGGFAALRAAIRQDVRLQDFPRTALFYCQLLTCRPATARRATPGRK